jgi:hypothetical protein
MKSVMKGDAFMLPVVHPISKTSTDLRRSINRLRQFKELNPSDPHVVDGSVDTLIKDLEDSRLHIPANLRDVDLTQ